MRVREVCRFDVATCGRSASALDVAKLLRERHVGAAIVVGERDGGGVPVGVATDRDLAIEVMAKEIDPASICAGDLLVRDCITVLDSDIAYEAIWQMRRGAVRRLPVVDGRGHLLGIVALDDLTRLLAQELKDAAGIADRQIEVETSRRQ